MIGKLVLRFRESGQLQLLALLSITVVGAILRMYKLGTWSFWFDETFTLGHVQAHFIDLEKIIQNIPPKRNWVPISVLLTAQSLNIFGISEWSARISSAIIGIASIPILYFPTKKIFGARVGLYAALLLAFSPWHIYWSQNARFYTSLMLLSTLALFAIFVSFEHNRRKYFILFFAFFYLAASERITVLLMIPAILIYFLLLFIFKMEKPPGWNRFNFIVVFFPGLLLIVFELYNFISGLPFRFFGDFSWFFLYESDSPFKLLSFVLDGIGIPLVILAAMGGIFGLTNKDRSITFLFSAAIIPVGLLVLISPFVFSKDRYVFMTLPFWIIIGAVTFNEISRQVKDKWKFLVAGILLMVIADYAGKDAMYYLTNNGNRPDWRGAFSMIEQRGQDDDLVVTYWPDLVEYYMAHEAVFYEDITVKKVIDSQESYWFVLDAETIYANKEIKEFLDRGGYLIEVKYLRTPEDNFLRVYHYSPED